jgi:HEAT repeat protein
MLSDSDGDVADAAAASLAAIGEPARGALAGALAGDQPAAAYRAAQALARQGEAAVPAIRQAADQSPRAAPWAVVALARIGGQSAIGTLDTLATQSADPVTRSDAAQAVRRLNMR